jgi:hypothetical protein
MSDQSGLNERGNHQGEFSQGVGGWAEYTVHMTEVGDKARHDVRVPPGKVIPVIFLPGVMGSNLRMTKKRQNDDLKRPDNRAWRPDDLMTIAGEIDVAVGNGMGNWLKNATPAQRQLIFDPNETEVEYYHYTESNERFDPDGKETLAADARHQNVPDSLEAIPPLMGQRSFPIGRGNSRSAMAKKRETPAQIARWRGWSEVLFAGAYGEMLKTAEKYLNNMLLGGEVNPIWQSVCVSPSEFGGIPATPISEVDLKKIAACWYPVHAMGYNFLQSNSDSAKAIAGRIRGLIKGYQKCGFKCDEVIIVTHSMGGLVGRALLHPDYGNMLNDKEVKILGMYHNVMPTIGAAATYKRMRFGFKDKWGPAASLAAQVIAIDGENATAILANTPAPLEMLPGRAYGSAWLKVVDETGKLLWSCPRGKAKSLESIYLQTDSAWWRLVNPLWVNPARAKKEKGAGIGGVYRRVTNAAIFLDSIEQTFHPTNCYASYCASSEHPSYGEVVFKAADLWNPFIDHHNEDLPPSETWKLLSDDAKGTLKVQAGSRVLVLYLQKAAAPGDETVPSDRSAKHINGTLFEHGKKNGTGYEHQTSYSDQKVLTSMLYSLVQIAKAEKWE